MARTQRHQHPGERALQRGARPLPRGVTRFVVVTSAVHMRRSLREFRRAGVEPIGAPVEYLGAPFGGLADLVPTASSIARTQ
ncbi:MAG: YdcF family protein [Deltaproteobacteria bacterium]|nr:YdcF family protein [Deltaproteobacteria bacterium]